MPENSLQDGGCHGNRQRRTRRKKQRNRWSSCSLLRLQSPPSPWTLRLAINLKTFGQKYWHHSNKQEHKYSPVYYHLHYYNFFVSLFTLSHFSSKSTNNSRIAVSPFEGLLHVNKPERRQSLTYTNRLTAQWLLQWTQGFNISNTNSRYANNTNQFQPPLILTTHILTSIEILRSHFFLNYLKFLVPKRYSPRNSLYIPCLS